MGATIYIYICIYIYVMNTEKTDEESSTGGRARPPALGIGPKHSSDCQQAGNPCLSRNASNDELMNMKQSCRPSALGFGSHWATAATLPAEARSRTPEQAQQLSPPGATASARRGGRRGSGQCGRGSDRPHLASGLSGPQQLLLSGRAPAGGGAVHARHQAEKVCTGCS